MIASLLPDRCHVLSKVVPFESLRLDNQLCFALYAATRAITRTYREGLEPIGLTYPKYLVLLVLWQSDGARVSEIGNRLMLNSGTISPVVKRLEAEGIVEHKRCRKDEREVEVWLTPKGSDLRESVERARDHVVCQLKMSEPEILALRNELMELIERLNKESYTEKEACS